MAAGRQKGLELVSETSETAGVFLSLLTANSCDPLTVPRSQLLSPMHTFKTLLSVCRACSELPLHTASCSDRHRVPTQSLCRCTFSHAW